MMRPRRVSTMTWEQALSVAQRGDPAAALALSEHMREGIEAIRGLGHDGHPSGKTTTLTFTGDSCQSLDIEPGSYGAIAEDQTDDSDDLGFTIEQHP